MTLDKLEDDLASLSGKRPRTFELWAQSHPAEREVVMRSVRDVTVPAKRLMDVLHAHDIPMSESTIRAYRESRS